MERRARDWKILVKIQIIIFGADGNEEAKLNVAHLLRCTGRSYTHSVRISSCSSLLRCPSENHFPNQAGLISASWTCPAHASHVLSPGSPRKSREGQRRGHATPQGGEGGKTTWCRRYRRKKRTAKAYSYRYLNKQFRGSSTQRRYNTKTSEFRALLFPINVYHFPTTP